MTQNKNDDEDNFVNEYARAMGLSCRISLSQDLSDLLSPNEFLSGMGINFDDRIKTILSLLKGNLIPKNHGKKEAVPKSGIVIPLPLARGPYIREELISIKAELSEDDSNEILLTIIRDPE